jgi:hypothetical protein
VKDSFSKGILSSENLRESKLSFGNSLVDFLRVLKFSISKNIGSEETFEKIGYFRTSHEDNFYESEKPNWKLSFGSSSLESSNGSLNVSLTDDNETCSA